MGKPVQLALEEDHHTLDFKRVFVSRRQVAGRTLAELNLTGRFGVVLTRIQRGDVELLPSHDTSLELGDRVRVVGPKENIAEVSRYLGDSYRALSEIDVVSFSLGIALGLLLGSVPIPLGGASFKLGFAGGPLLVGLLLGALGRTGPLVWQMPYSASLTIRQLGLILFLAGIGIRSGGAFAQTLMGGDGWRLLMAGAMLTLSTALLILWVGHRLLKVPLPVLGGILAGAQTQPAVLAFVLEKTQRDEPNQGYTSVYPLAMLLKIVMVQLLLR
jgi:putative transport protein